MATSVKRLVRDRLVNDATIRGFFSAAATGSARVYPVFMETTGKYPQIVYSEIPGPTDPGMSASNGIVTLSIETQATGGVNPHINQELILERMDQLFDDQAVTGLAISGTSVYTFLMLREGGTEISYSSERKTYQRFQTYSYKVINY